MDLIILKSRDEIASLLNETWDGHDLDEVVLVAEMRTTCPTCGQDVFASVFLYWETDDGIVRVHRFRDGAVDAECGTCGKAYVPRCWVSKYADPAHVQWALENTPGREALRARLEHHVCVMLQPVLEELGLI